jgi:hypothetical protein
MDFKIFAFQTTSKIHLGNDDTINDPKAAVEKFLKREYQEIYAKETDVIFVPDSFNYKDLPCEVIFSKINLKIYI